MNLRDLKYLVAVAELRHFGNAARACHVSQPTLSTQIRKLEDYLGVRLFERSRQQIMLTVIGEQVVAEARHALDASERIVQLAQQASSPMGGELHLGIIPTVAPYLLPEVLPVLRAHLPDLNIVLVETQTEILLERMQTGQLDAAILALPLPGMKLQVQPLYAEPFYLALGRSHPWHGYKSVDMAQLNAEEVLLLEDGHCLRDQTLEICKHSGAVARTDFSATSLETLRHMVASGEGVTLIPELALQPDNAELRYLPFRGAPPHRVIGMIWRGTTVRKDVLTEIARMLRKTVSTSLSLSGKRKKHR